MNAVETNPVQDLSQSELVLTRVYDAPRALGDGLTHDFD